ncbi:hypothetical protein THER5_1903 [Bifidobacterium thermacidophilum subsp. thermacidophilum]|uniref:Uncharacterized protein n=1 Tax=Bifidobacterium thermacidophilum subsp. thermacidophilum TaxID=79262 RepID=A0A087E2A8_9BIFI|nr:hypothetical protein THER5_1903 [Bifidobacterium thermacidophilum subsp. thermacidophilum]
MVSGSRAAGPGRRVWYGRIALSFMIRGVLPPHTGRPRPLIGTRPIRRKTATGRG